MKKILRYFISDVLFSLAIVSLCAGLFFLTLFCIEMVNIVFDCGISVPENMNNPTELFVYAIVFISVGVLAGFVGKEIYEDNCL